MMLSSAIDAATLMIFIMPLYYDAFRQLIAASFHAICSGFSPRFSPLSPLYFDIDYFAAIFAGHGFRRAFRFSLSIFAAASFHIFISFAFTPLFSLSMMLAPRCRLLPFSLHYYAMPDAFAFPDIADFRC